jgi:hypothetical protein
MIIQIVEIVQVVKIVKAVDGDSRYRLSDDREKDFSHTETTSSFVQDFRRRPFDKLRAMADKTAGRGDHREKIKESITKTRNQMGLFSFPRFSH